MKKIIYCIILLIIILFGTAYLKLKNSELISPVVISLDCSSDTFEQIDFFSISPKKKIDKFIKDSINHTFYSKKKGYISSIIFKFDNDLNKIKNIEVKIGDKKILFNNNEISDKWKQSNINNEKYYNSPDILYINKSGINLFKNIINWKGDFNLILINIVNSIFICLLIVIIYIYLFNFDSYPKTKLFFELYEKRFLIVFLFIILLSFLKRFTIFQIPYLTGDAWGYIGPSVLFNENGELYHIGLRSFLYPLFLISILKIFNSFSYICIVQHLIGIFTGILLLYLWFDVIRFINIDKSKYDKYKNSGLLLLAVYLLSDTNVILENYILRESIYPFFLILIIIVLIKIIKNFSNSRKFFVYSVLYFFINYFLFVYQPRWGLNIIFNILIFIILILLKKNKIFYKIIIVSLAIIICFAFIYLPEEILFKDKTTGQSFLFKHLFFTNAKIVDKILESDINDADFYQYDKEILNRTRFFFKEAFDKNKGLKYIGFNVNSIMHGPANDYLLQKFNNDKEYSGFLKYYFYKMFKKYPLLFMKKILYQMFIFYNFSGGMYSDREYTIDSIKWNYALSELPDGKFTYTAYNEFKDLLNNIKSSFYDFNEMNFYLIDLIILILSKTYLFVLFIFLFIFIKNSIRFFNKKEDNENYYFMQVFTLIIFLYNFFINLTGAIIYSLDVNRYIDDQFLPVFLSNFLAFFFIITEIKNNNKLNIIFNLINWSKKN